ncbi:MAG: hypothetical protein ACI905_002333 [Roseivirga sp.]
MLFSCVDLFDAIYASQLARYMLTLFSAYMADKR